jgi:hypothetical protein
MIKFTHRGDFARTTGFLKRAQSLRYREIIEQYAKDGVAALESATPKDTGLTSNSWSYNINISKRGLSVSWTNSQMAGKVPLVILLQYGHATRNGGFVQGQDFINPTIKPIFDRIAESLWREVTRP